MLLLYSGSECKLLELREFLNETNDIVNCVGAKIERMERNQWLQKLESLGLLSCASEDKIYIDANRHLKFQLEGIITRITQAKLRVRSKDFLKDLENVIHPRICRPSPNYATPCDKFSQLRQGSYHYGQIRNKAKRSKTPKNTLNIANEDYDEIEEEKIPDQACMSHFINSYKLSVERLYLFSQYC